MLNCQRSKFSIPDTVHYLNCAYMSPNLKTVETAGVAGVSKKSRPWEITGVDFFEPVEILRTVAGRLVNASADRVALIPAASYGAAICGAAVPLSRGQNVVLVAEEFPSVVYVWRERCRDAAAQVRTVSRPVDTDQPAIRWNEQILEAIDKNTAAVALTAVHWTDGTPFDLAAIGARCREVGAAFIVDGTQSVGAVPFDFAEVRPDFLYTAGYKWLLGPYSLGLAVVGDRFLEAEPLEYNWITRHGSENFANLVDYRDGYQPGARRFDMGGRSSFALVPMLTAALQQLVEWTPAAIEAYCSHLATFAAQQLENTPYLLPPRSESRSHLFGIHIPDPTRLSAIQEALQRRNVQVSLRGTALRVSPHVYNTEADIAALTEALRAAQV